MFVISGDALSGAASEVERANYFAGPSQACRSTCLSESQLAEFVVRFVFSSPVSSGFALQRGGRGKGGVRGEEGGA